MAVIHDATLVPSKLELVARWLTAQSWCPAGVTGAGDVERVGAYRFDDPDGEVGLEAHLVRAGGVLVHVPLSYRAAELPGSEGHLVGTLEHSVLGRRWVHDAAGDPVFARVLADVVTGRAAQAALVGPDGAPLGEPDVRVGPGAPGAGGPDGAGVVDSTTTAGVRLGLVRVLDGAAVAPAGAATLTGTWAGRDEPALLAWTR
ncbi:maltokinase N-terminal cap-like domain-containing protein [Kineococcus sp. G2]|uniref:maltokinase N-terminal cap-like domain-containing protein n=1 Tax=Kineococcus sp. G2 TaxID=3127484 RepID=UPI00301C5E1C